jgi:hypothetical protein
MLSLSKHGAGFFNGPLASLHSLCVALASNSRAVVAACLVFSKRSAGDTAGDLA